MEKQGNMEGDQRITADTTVDRSAPVTVDTATVQQAHVTVDTATGQQAPAQLSAERTRRIFGRIAERYDLFNQLSSLGIYKRWLKALVQEARQEGASSGTRMLDVAGGTGDVSFAIAQAVGPQSIELTDYTPEMLAVAQRRLDAGEGCGVTIHTAEADGQALPFDDGSFDLVTCSYGIRNMPDRQAALSEAYRVLAPDGVYAVLDFSTPPNALWRGLYHIYLRLVIPTIGGLLTGDRAGFVYLNDSIRAFPDQENLASMLRDAGFSQVRYRNLSGGIAALHIARK